MPKHPGACVRYRLTKMVLVRTAHGPDEDGSPVFQTQGGCYWFLRLCKLAPNAGARAPSFGWDACNVCQYMVRGAVSAATRNHLFLGRTQARARDEMVQLNVRTRARVLTKERTKKQHTLHVCKRTREHLWIPTKKWVLCE